MPTGLDLWGLKRKARNQLDTVCDDLEDWYVQLVVMHSLDVSAVNLQIHPRAWHKRQTAFSFRAGLTMVPIVPWHRALTFMSYVPYGIGLRYMLWYQWQLHISIHA